MLCNCSLVDELFVIYIFSQIQLLQAQLAEQKGVNATLQTTIDAEKAVIKPPVVSIISMFSF